jgi:hypothetical protein
MWLSFSLADEPDIDGGVRRLAELVTSMDDAS